MNKSELVDQVQKLLGKEATKAEAQRAVEATLDGIISGLAKKKEGTVVQLVGFGTFRTVKRAARKGRNPQTGEEIKIKASKSVSFKPGKALKEKL